MILREAALWLVLAVCILIFISYFGIGGYVGAVVSDVSFGVFGITAYLFPFLLFISAAFLVSNRGSHVAGLKFLSSVGLFLCICSFATLFTKEYQEITAVTELYEQSASSKNGGGVLGGVVCALLRPALGTAGTGIVLLILAIVFLVLITQKSLMRSVKQQGSRVCQSARESHARRREARARQNEWDLPQEIADVPGPLSSRETQPEPSLPEKSPEKASRGRKKPAPAAARETGNQPSSGRAAERAVRTEIDVPVLFPVSPREHRRVTGVTMDTKIEGDPEKIGTEVHEIMPKVSPMPRTRGRRAERPADSRFPGENFIELDASQGRRAAQSAEPELELYHDSLSELHIEGISPAYEMPESYVRADETPSETAQKGRSDASAGNHGYEASAGSCGNNASAGNHGHDTPAGNRGHDASTENSRNDISAGNHGHDVSAGNHGDRANAFAGGDEAIPEESARAEAEKPAAASGTAAPDKASGAQEPSSRRNPRSSQKEIDDGIASVEAEMAVAAGTVKKEYIHPPLDLLKKGKNNSAGNQEQEIRSTAAKLQQTLNSFGVRVTVTNVSCGPSVTRYELLPEQGVKVSRIVALSDDIKLNLAAADIRIEAPIPGKAAVGIEVPNSENSAVPLRDLLESDAFQKHPSKLAFATGKDIGGKVVVSDIAKMPHLLIAGATGSGKSVCINTLIMSLLYKASPDEVKLIMIDPKVVELSVYNGIPHLLIPVVTDPKKAAGALNWGVAEMTDRYAKFAEFGVRDLKGYNQKIESIKDIEDENKPQKLPQIVIIVDELADLMMVAPGEVEDSICRLAQLARAAGIHLIIATQRPSVNVITGLIKANMPSRIAFSVSSGVDSRTIIDMNGAEKLLGKGDMLFYPQGYQKPARVQGAFVSDEEVADVVDFLKNENSAVSYDAQMEEQIAKVQQAVAAARGGEDMDALFADAGKFIIDKDKASIGMLQRVFKIGFNRAARIMDQLADAGVVGPEEGTKPRKILMSAEEFENYLEQN